ncbi:hypothetical protein K3495_g6041 [Podosphaera aphanis]|nr:hypothetical protein K3495_g6041 [Podosphaera aphanis]
MPVLANKLNLNDTILYIKSCEPIAPSRGPAQASISRGRGGIRDRCRGKNGRGGRKCIHHRNENGKIDFRRDNRRRPGRRERKTWGKNQCKWCMKHGHYEAECDSYHFYRRQALGDNKTEDHSAAAGYAARIGPRRDPNEYIISSYVSVASHSDKSRAFSASSFIHSIIESGATEHFSGRRSDFRQMKRWSFSRTVTVAHGNEVMCEGYGTIIINTDHNMLELDNVWFVPEFGNMRLISVWRLNDAGIELRFNDHRCQLWKNSNIIMSTIRTLTSNQNRRFVRNKESIWELYHRRLGHVYFQDIKKLVDLGVLGGKVNLEKRPVYQEEKHCESCLAGRMKERFNKKTGTRECVKGRRLHADISGIQGVSVRGFRYYLIVVDDASRIYWVTLLKSNETKEVLNILRQIITMVELQYENKV